MGEFKRSEKKVGKYTIKRRSEELTTVYKEGVDHIICAYMHPWNGHPATPYIYGVVDDMKGETWDQWLARLDPNLSKAITQGMAQ